MSHVGKALTFQPLKNPLEGTFRWAREMYLQGYELDEKFEGEVNWKYGMEGWLHSAPYLDNGNRWRISPIHRKGEPRNVDTFEEWDEYVNAKF